jgi:protein-tyrosine-phosphatase
MKIHFVSYGHAFRSRLAEAYMKYLLRKYKNIQISSSGIILENELNGPVAWYAMKILAQHALVPYMSIVPEKTTKEMIDSADRVIFMDRHSYEFCVKKFGYKGREHEMWDLGYIPPDKVERGKDLDYDIMIIERSEEIFIQIKNHCRRIYNDLSMTDIPLRSEI